MAHQRRLGKGEHDEHIHGSVFVQARGANVLHDAHAAEDLHGARVAALHLGEESRLGLLFDEDGAYAATAEIEREDQPHRACADDNYLCFHCFLRVSMVRTERNQNAEPGP